MKNIIYIRTKYHNIIIIIIIEYCEYKMHEKMTLKTFNGGQYLFYWQQRATNMNGESCAEARTHFIPVLQCRDNKIIYLTLHPVSRVCWCATHHLSNVRVIPPNVCCAILFFLRSLYDISTPQSIFKTKPYKIISCETTKFIKLCFFFHLVFWKISLPFFDLSFFFSFALFLLYFVKYYYIT